MLIRRLAVCTALLATTLVLMMGHASATEVPTLQCGVNPTTDVRLDRDLTCANSFVIGDSSATTPLTIDLAGHTLTVTNPDATCKFGQAGTSCAVFGIGPIRMIDGSVRGGVGLGAVRGANDLFRVDVAGDIWVSGVGGRIIKSSVTGGSVRVFSSTFTLKYSDIVNGGISFNDLDTQMAIDIEVNHILHSPTAGIAGVLGQGGEFPNDLSGVIAANVITGPTGAGISLTGALTNIGGLALQGNRIFRSGADGILIQGVAIPPTPYLGGPVTLTHNTVIGSAGYGINAPWVTNLSGTGIVDGGRNLARHTTLSPCVGIICRR